jgi:hypothetical protein
MADSLFGPSPAEVMYARQKELTDQQNRQYEAMLATASTPAERNYMLAGNLLSQAISPLFNAGRQDPMLQKATATQSILSKYGPDAINNPDSLNTMAREFAAVGMQNEAFQLAQMANELVKNRPDQFITASGKRIMELFGNQISGLNEFASYRVNTKTGDIKEIGSEITIGSIPAGTRLVRTEKGLELQTITDTASEEQQFNQAVDAATLAAQSRRNVSDALRILEENDYTRFLDGAFIRWLSPGSWANKLVPTEVGNLHAAIKSLNSQVALGALARLKSLSSTGASGLGAVNMREWSALESSIISLDPNTLTASQLYANLKRIDEQFKSIINKVVNQEDKEKAAQGLRLLRESGIVDEYFDTSGGDSSGGDSKTPDNSSDDNDPLGILT